MGYGELTSYHLAHTTEQGTKLHLKEPPIAWTGTLDHSGQPSNRKSEHYSFRVSQEISQTDFPAESQPGHFYRPGANKPGLRAQRQDYEDLIWMYFPPFSSFLKFSFFPAAVTLPLLYFQPGMKTKSLLWDQIQYHFCKQAGENFINDLRHQRPWEAPDTLGDALLSPQGPPPTPSAFSAPYFLYLACALIPDSWGQGVNSSNNLQFFHSWAHPGSATAPQPSKTISLPLTCSSNPAGPGGSAVDSRLPDDTSLILKQVYPSPSS